MSAAIDPQLLAVLACPKCKGELRLAENEKELICDSCLVVYPIRNRIPVMLVEEARPLGTTPSVASEKAIFAIVEGENKGEKIELGKGTCRALGRSLDDAQRTQIFSVDSAITLDEASKKIVLQYVTKQFKGGAAKKGESGEAIGGFLREPDIQLKDLAVSRLHAMIFFDASGEVGILDLVSKNGTYVNGIEIESKVLKKGDLVTLGGTKIRFES